MLSRFLLFSVLLCSLATAANSKDAVMVQLNPDGLKVIAKEVQSRQMQDIRNEALPDINAKGPLSVDVSIQGARFSVDFDQLDLTPVQNRLGIHVAMNNISVHIDKLTFKKNLLVDIGSTCSNTKIILGGARKIHAMATFAPSVKNRQLKLTPTMIEFPIQDNNFEVRGPSHCTGVLGTGHLVKWVVNEVLSRASSVIQKKVEETIAGTVPMIEEKMNAVVHQDFPFSVPPNPVIPATMVHLATYPYSVSVSPAGLEFHLSVEVSQNRVANRNRDVNRARTFLPLGIAGVNPELMNELFAVILKNGTEYIDIDEALVPGLSDLLEAKTLAQLLPDLADLPLQSKTLKAHFRLAQAPRLTIRNGEKAVWAEFPEIHIKLLVNMGGTWRDYFIMKMRMVAGAIPGIEQGDMSIALAADHKVSIRGEWAPGYTPKTRDFDATAAEDTGSALLSLMHDIGAFVIMEVPVFNVGEKEVTVIEPHIDSPFIRVKIVSIEK